jgi:hypothetical protein
MTRTPTILEAVDDRHLLGATIDVDAEVKAGQRAGAKPGQFAARRRVRSAASAPTAMAGVSQPYVNLIQSASCVYRHL